MMSNFVSTGLAAVVALAAVSIASAQWQDITGNIPGPPSAGDQASLLFADGELYVLGQTGVYRSTDGGASFSTINAVTGTGAYDLGVSQLRFVKKANTFIYVGDARNAVSNTENYTPLHRLSAGQTSWTQASQVSLPDTVFTDSVEDMAYDAATGAYYAASNFAGCYYSADGLIWEERRHGLPTQGTVDSGPFANATSVLVRDGKVFLTVNHPSLGGVFTSTDQGLTWTRTSVPSGGMARLFEQDGRVMVATSGTTILDQGTYVTDDNGVTWERRPFLSLLSQIRGNGSLLVATPGIYQAQDLRFSSTRGDTWDEIDRAGLPANYVWRAIEPSATDLYLIGYDLNPTDFSPQNMKVFKRPIGELNLTPSPQFFIDPALISGGFRLNVGAPFSLTVGSAPAGTVSYVWRRNGDVLPNQTSATLSLPSVTLADAGSYTVEIIGSGGSSGVSRSVSLDIAPSGPGNGDTSFPQADSGRTGTLVLYHDFRLLHADGNYLALYGADGRLVTTRTNAADGRLRRGFMDSRGNLILFGEFTLTRLDADTLADDGSFTPVVFAGSTVRLHDVIELPGRGYLLAVESGSTLGGVSIPRTALFDYDGNFVPSATFAGVGRRLALGPDGSIYVGQTGIQRMFSNGTLDASFTSSAGGASFALQPDGSIIYAAGGSASPLRRLNADGTVDAGFTSRIPSLNNGSVTGIIAETSGKILVYGGFKSASGVTASGHYRLNADGSPDPTYSASRGYEFFGTASNIGYALYDPRGGFFFLPGTANMAYPQIGRTGLVRVFADQPGINLWQQPVPQSVASGGRVTLRAGVTGTSAVSYQWYKDGEPIAGATSATLTLSGFGAADAGRYSFTATNASGTVTSREAIVDLVGAPAVVNLSKPIVANEGTPLNLSVTASGDATLTYQWTKNGTPIASATEAAFSLPSAGIADSGDYRVIISNGVATITSDAVSVTFLPITARVLPGTVPSAPSALLNAIAVLPDQSYLVGGAVIPTTSSTIAFHHISATGEVLDDAWTALGQPSLVTIVTMIELNRAKDRVYVYATNQISRVTLFNRYFLDGTRDTSFVPAAAGPLLAERPDGSLWIGATATGSTQLALISPAGALIRTVAPPSNSNSSVRKIIALEDGSILVGGSFRDLSMASSSAIKGLIRIREDGTVDEDFPVVLQGSVVMDMVMQSSGKIVAALSNNTLVRLTRDWVLDTTFNGTGLPSGSIVSLEVELDDQIIVLGATSTFRRTKDGAADGSFLPLTDFSSANIRAVQADPTGRLYAAGTFTLRSTGASVTTAILTTTVVPVGFTRPLADSSGEVGGSSTFTPVYYSDGPVTFQWFFNGIPIPGAEEESLTLTNLGPADGSGTYTVTITHASGSVTSAPASLQVIGTPEIIGQPLVAQTVDRGGQISLSVTAIGKSPLAYAWSFEGEPIPGADASTLEIASATLADSGCYTVRVTNSLGAITSANAAVAVQVPYGDFDTAISLTPDSSRRATAIVEIPGGGYYVGGNFSTINGVAQAGIVKVSDSGEVLPFTVSGVTLGFNFYDIDVQSDGKVLYATNGGYGRLHANGSLDTTFPHSTTLAKGLLVVGNTLYVAVQTPGSNDPRMRKFDLLSNTEDTEFAANFAAHQSSAFSSTSDLALLTDGKIAFGGTGNNWGIINPDGTLAAGFTNILGNPSFGDPARSVYGVTAAPGGQVYLSGSFLLANTRSIARMNADGSLDETFISSLNSTLANGVLDGDGIVVRGLTAGLTRFGPTGAHSYPANGSTTSVNSLIKDSKSRAVFGTTNAPLVARAQLDTGDPLLITCPPSLSSNPVTGKPVSLGVAWSGMGPVTYQWNKDEAPIAGATSQVYTIARYHPAEHEGTYTVTITHRAGTITTEGQTIPNADPITDYYAAAGIPENLRTDSGDFDNDGIPNLLEYFYGSNAGSSASRAPFRGAELELSGAAINGVAGTSLDPARTFYVVEIRLPKNRQGLTVTMEATTTVPNYGNGSASLQAYGPVIDDGDFTIQRHYLLPSDPAAAQAFWRIVVSR